MINTNISIWNNYNYPMYKVGYVEKISWKRSQNSLNNKFGQCQDSDKIWKLLLWLAQPFNCLYRYIYYTFKNNFGPLWIASNVQFNISESRRNSFIFFSFCCKKSIESKVNQSSSYPSLNLCKYILILSRCVIDESKLKMTAWYRVSIDDLQIICKLKDGQNKKKPRI